MPPEIGTVPEGESRWEAALFGANDFRRFGAVDEDSETWRLSGKYRLGLREGREFWVEGALIHRGPGGMDGIIDWWHTNVLQWTDPVRDATPRGRTVVARNGEYRFGGADGIGDLTVGLSQSLDARTTAIAALKLPTGDPSALLGSGGVDFGVSLNHRLPVSEELAFAFQLALIAQSDATDLPGTRGLVDQELIAVIWQPNSCDSWIAQWQSERSPIVTGEPGADATHRILVFGYRRQLSARDSLELSFSEDRDVFLGRIPEFANIGPDFGIGVRFVRRL